MIIQLYRHDDRAEVVRSLCRRLEGVWPGAAAVAAGSSEPEDNRVPETQQHQLGGVVSGREQSGGKQ